MILNVLTPGPPVSVSPVLSVAPEPVTPLNATSSDLPTKLSMFVVSGQILQKDMYLIQIVNLVIYFVIFVITHN